MKISCIIPAYNEESTINAVLQNVKKVRTIDEIIVVDDGSLDMTYRCAISEGVKVIRHKKNCGKGAAIKTGISYSKGDILLFLDADLCSISPKKITSILQPLENDEADFVKTSFDRVRGRVTELVAKPLFRVIFPFIQFKQPLSGQFAVKREFLSELKIDDKWGVDIQILLQLIKKGVRISEVNIGRLVHKKQPIESLTIMSEQVIKIILSELGIIANKHKLVIFDFDKTLIKESSIEVAAKELGFTQQLALLRKKVESKRMKHSELTLSLAKYFQGKTKADINKICAKLTLSKNIIKVIERLKKRQYKVAIVSDAFYPLIECIAEKIEIDKENIVSPLLIYDKKGHLSGELIVKTKYNSKCCNKLLCKSDSAKELMKRFSVKPEECIAVGDGKSDECLFRACGLSLAYKPKIKIGDIIITNLTEILIYAE